MDDAYVVVEFGLGVGEAVDEAVDEGDVLRRFN